jgi:hypothetical protein
MDMAPIISSAQSGGSAVVHEAISEHHVGKHRQISGDISEATSAAPSLCTTLPNSTQKYGIFLNAVDDPHQLPLRKLSRYLAPDGNAIRAVPSYND